MKNLILVITCMAITWASYAQPLALKKFLQSDFIHELDSIRQRAEKSVVDFKAIGHLYSEEDVALVRDKYDAAAGLFNNVLLNVKRDLLDKGKRKFIRKYPADYSKIMVTDLSQAKTFYEEEYMYTITEITDDKINGFAWLMSILTIYQLAEEGWRILSVVKDKWKDFNEKTIDKYLIEKHRFRLWDDL